LLGFSFIGRASISVRNANVFPGLPVSRVAIKPYPALVPAFGTSSISKPNSRTISFKNFEVFFS
jgi:hypothetical protein